MNIQTYKNNNVWKQGDVLVPEAILEKEEAHKEGKLHLSTHLLIYNMKGELYLRKRSDEDERYAGLITTSIGTHVEQGKDYLSTLLPILPLHHISLKYIGEFRVKDQWENEINGLHTAMVPVNCFPKDFDKDRRFIPKKELETLINEGRTTQHLKEAYALMRGYDGKR